MNARTSIQVNLGASLFGAGVLLEIGAVLGFFLPGLAALLPSGVVSHLLAAALLAAGGSLVVTSRSRLSQSFGIGFLFLTLAVLLPGVGPPVILALTAVLCHHAWKPRATKVPLTEVTTTPATRGATPITAPLVGLRQTLPPQDLQAALLGMGHMAPGDTRPLLKSLRKHRDVRVSLYANGLLNDHLNLFEKRLSALQNRVEEDPRDTIALTALVETYAALIDNALIPADETAQTAMRALTAAQTALAVDPANPPVLAAKARFELLQANFSDAYATIQQLYALPDCFDQARALHAELLFEHAATRAVHTASGSPVTPRVPQHALN